jgi:hypothetical protein
VSRTEPSKAFFVWLARHPSEREALRDVPPEVLGTLWSDAWRDGGWAAIHDTSELSGMVDRLEELIGLYRTAEVDREAERASVYWHTEPEDQEALPF